ncbi:MAG: hypothetical protein RLY71_421 [Pseudomonadota bacterium]
MTVRLRHNARFNTSPLSGAGQGISLPGARWALTVTLPRQFYADRARVEAFIHRLSGVEHRAQLWDQARAEPLQLSGSPLVNGALAQFATTLALDGVIYPGQNRVRFSQDIDNAWWVKTATGTGTVPAVVANDGVAPDGSTTADKVTLSIGAGTTTGDRSTVSANSTDCASVVGTAQVFAIWLKSADASTYAVRIDFNGIGGGVFTITPTWQRCVIAIDGASVTGAVFIPSIRLRGAQGTSATAVVHIWGGTFVRGTQIDPGYSGPPAATPGDWLQLPLVGGGNQLVQVVAGASGETLSGVEFRPPLRAAVADNSAITIVRPAALYRIADIDGVAFQRDSGGICPEMSIDLVEEFS